MNAEHQEYWLRGALWGMVLLYFIMRLAGGVAWKAKRSKGKSDEGK